MATKNTDRITVYLPPDLKQDIRNMSNETGYTVNQIALMSLTSLTIDYKEKGKFIFIDLLCPRK